MSACVCLLVKVGGAAVSVWSERPPEAGELGLSTMSHCLFILYINVHVGFKLNCESLFLNLYILDFKVTRSVEHKASCS